MGKKKVYTILGVLLASGVVLYFLSKSKKKNSKATGKQMIGKKAKLIPFGQPNSSGEEDYDGTKYDGITKSEPNRSSIIDSKIPQGEDVTFDILDESGDWVYIFGESKDTNIYTGWVLKNSITLI